MILTIFVAFCLVALLFIALIMPGASSVEDRAPFWGMYFAHRGLHTKDKAVPENSLAAFTAAVDAGYGIELDIRLAADGEVVVFHDDTLLRMCGAPGRVADLTLAQLRELKLLDTDQGIPTLWETLYVVKGKVPLLVELKSGPQHKRLCEEAWKILRTYEGDVCIQSFDPRMVRWYKKHVPGLLRGQLAARPKELRASAGLAAYPVGWGLTHFLGRPHFIAHRKGPVSPIMRLARRLAMRMVWTAHPDDSTFMLEEENEAIIFEYYEPEPRFVDPPGVPNSWPEDETYRF
ncbi:MAG: glycerophosphodiester phosphodiesterase [Ruminococcaceae bacterium]|nr:glycerophosphodiester phosphodiesterase [Oscillospiraceae bacterium]